MKAKGNGWLLSITLVGARNLPASKEAGVSDPYVVFTCSGKARTSSVKLQTSNPDWEGCKEAHGSQCHGFLFSYLLHYVLGAI